VDINEEETAVREANILKIPTVAVVDTNCDPDVIDHIIPSNDDAIRAIKLIVGKMADAALEGIAMRKEAFDEAVTDVDGYTHEEFDGMEDAEDEVLLGESTLAKLRDAESDAEELEESADVEDGDEAGESGTEA